MSALLHIASVVVHHRPDAVAALRGAVAGCPGAELALSEGGRSVVLLEGAAESALLDAMDRLRDVAGVIGVSLVHHHAEPEDQLLMEVDDGHAP
ncbi:MAG: chaperone NapD [Lysobacteraceae bacterium]